MKHIAFGLTPACDFVMLALFLYFAWWQAPINSVQSKYITIPLEGGKEPILNISKGAVLVPK